MSAPPAKPAVSGGLTSHDPSIKEDELRPAVGSSVQKAASGSGSFGSAAVAAAASHSSRSRGSQRRSPSAPSLGDRARSYLLSTHFQCAVQLTVGVVFLSLFVLVDKMRFPMSCQAAVIYAALTLQLFPNVHMGGRIAAASIATGCIFIGAFAGGLAVSVAWWAKGAGKNSLIKAVKATMAGPPSPEKAALAVKLAAAMSAKKGAATGASQAEKPKPTLGEAMEFLTQLPIVGSGYYVVLCVVGVAAMALFAVVRCDPKNNAVGGLGSILAVVTGLVVANAGAVPVIGLKGFWGAVVVRIIQLGLVASAATLVSGALVMPTKATDALVLKLSGTVAGVGSSVTGFGGGLRRVVDAAEGEGSSTTTTTAAEAEAASKRRKDSDPEVGLVGEAINRKKSSNNESGSGNGNTLRNRRRRFGRKPHGVFYSDKIALTLHGNGKGEKNNYDPAAPLREAGEFDDVAAGADRGGAGAGAGGGITDAELLARLRADSTPPAFDHDGSVIDGMSDDEEAGDGVSSSSDDDEDDDGGKFYASSVDDARNLSGKQKKHSISPSPSGLLLSHSNSRRPDGSASLPAGHGLREPVTWWRGHLAEANTLLAEARFEPPALFTGGRAAGGFRPGRWARVIARADALISRGAALEELCRSPGAASAAVLLRRLHGRDVGVPYREAIGAAAAALASLARLLSAAASSSSNSSNSTSALSSLFGGSDSGAEVKRLWESRSPGLHGPDVWRGLRRSLAETARSLQSRYWEALSEGGGGSGNGGGGGGGKKNGGGGGKNDAGTGQKEESMTSHDAVVAMRGYHHATMLCGGLVDAVSDLEGAVVEALGLERGGGGGRGGEREDSPRDEEQGGGVGVSNGVGNGIDSVGDVGDEKSGKAKKKKKEDPNPWVIWAATIFAGLSGLMVWMRLLKVALGLPRVASAAIKRCRSGESVVVVVNAVDDERNKPLSPLSADDDNKNDNARTKSTAERGRREKEGTGGPSEGSALDLSEIDTADAATPSLDRAAVVFGLKYFAATSLTLVACVLLLWKFPAQLFDWQISTAFVVMAVCLQPRLEDTVPRAVLQACLVLLGGSLGYGVMLRGDLAANPGYVGFLLAATVFVFGHINALQAVKKPLFLMLSTFMASLLCQYPRPATAAYLGGRVASTAAGSLLALVFSAFVFPARASHECLDSVADALEASASIVAGAWGDFSRAAKASSSSSSSSSRSSSSRSRSNNGSSSSGDNNNDASRGIPRLRADRYLADLQRKVDAPLAHASALARVDALPSLFDSCLPRGTDLVTPMPPAVKPMAAAASAVARRVAALQLATSRECWDSSSSGSSSRSGKKKKEDEERDETKNPNGALSGFAAAALVAASDAQVQAAVDDTVSLIAAVADSLRTRGDDRGMLLYFLPGGTRSVEQKRLVIVERIRAAEKSRVAATRAIRASIPEIIAAASTGKLTAEEDLEFEAWAAAFFSCLDALLAAGRAGASRVAQRRSSAASMFGLC